MSKQRLLCALSGVLMSGVNADLVVTGGTQSISRFNDVSGAPLGLLGTGMTERFEGVAFGPDNLIYSSTNDLGYGRVYRANGASPGFAVDFAPSGQKLAIPEGMTFGPDGNMYVTSNAFLAIPSSVTGVMKYSLSGSDLGQFVASTGINDYAYDVAFAPGGDLFLSIGGPFHQQSGSPIKRYNGTTGAFVSDFVPTGSGGLGVAAGIAFGPDGNLYVCDYDNDRVLRYDGTSGAFLNSFVATGSGGLNGPSDVAFGPDGNLYVVSHQTSSVQRYSGLTGASIDTFVPTNSGGLENPLFLAFSQIPEPGVTGTFTVLLLPIFRRRCQLRHQRK
jgi:DNA-binding beta-propeller fold protein YncE